MNVDSLKIKITNEFTITYMNLHFLYGKNLNIFQNLPNLFIKKSLL